MIIKSTRIRAESGHKAVATHVLRGKDNEQVACLSGDETLLVDAVADARSWQRRYALRHFSVNPDAPLERRDAVAVFQSLASEFGFDLQRCLIVEHQKPRARNAGFGQHWHLLVPEVDPLTGRVLSSSHSYLRQEKIARRAELRFGHKLTRGRHNTAVVAALEAEGRTTAAQQLEQEGLTDGPLPQAAYTSDQHQAAKREGLSLPQARAAVKAAWEASDSAQALTAALAEQGLGVAPGDKPGTWIITHSNGRVLGALHRFAGVRKAAVSQRMKGETHENQRTTAAATRRATRPSDIRPDPQDLQTHRRHPRPPEQPARGRGRPTGAALPDTAADGPAPVSDRTALAHRLAAARLRAAYKRNPRRLYPLPPAVPTPKPQTRPAAGAIVHPLVGTAIQTRRQAEAVAARWRRLGCHAKARDTHVLVTGKDWRIADHGNRCLFDKAHPEAIALAMTKAKREWGGAVLASGSQAFLELAWLEAQRQGVRFSVKGKPDWQPPPHVLAQWRQEQAPTQTPPEDPGVMPDPDEPDPDEPVQDEESSTPPPASGPGF
ncbi:LPD7 domain-containing protein [Aquibaculum arenosum]|uniref:Large polyvalent protein-associated domain-containing protein n=1 Tax=Aquibaculum arenosum TaxID=3032591 RepID=A0ABT5YTJ4_9PROT|nr:LPD7 domain-containing protein [Fodinicurvata sp. CAU 1616]MDF2097524.1 hypothetical protein [Fodinicurvata sp. CAU 1616]